ncbi:hypothetical protein FAM09_23305 [Niastella caeni]|uniref:VWA domain-containing protein n=1 Tax=Niastella caeni TaxID=2569763 RepID=A0A4S8HPI5_9BACT|nr:hypothetical protein [Niastella caeni]THU34922.1 hypothetical protein FAM09_23305 [Niastella caeni]
MRKSIRLLINVVIVVTGCSKPQNDILSEVGIVQGSSSLISYTNNSCVLKLTYAINGNVNDGNLLPTHLFHFNHVGLIEGARDIDLVTCEVVETKLLNKPLLPASIFLLMDKSILSITESFNLDQLLPFKEAFFQNLSENIGKFEVNFGICAVGNPKVPVYRTMFSKFQEDHQKLQSDSLAPVFDIKTNGGSSNLVQSIDTTLSYINSHARYANRILFVYTDYLSGVPDTAVLTPLVSKAKSSNTHIVLYNTMAPDRVLYSHRRYVNGSDGFQFTSLSGGLVWSATYRNMNTLFGIFNGKPMYETTMRLVSGKDFFATNKYGLLFMSVELFNHAFIGITPLYER